MVADELPDLDCHNVLHSITQFPQEFTPQTLWHHQGESQRAAQRSKPYYLFDGQGLGLP